VRDRTKWNQKKIKKHQNSTEPVDYDDDNEDADDNGCILVLEL